MENKVRLVFSDFIAHHMNPASFDDMDGYDSKPVLESIVRNLEELCLEISVKPKPESKLPPKYHKNITIDFELKKEYPYYFLLRRTEQSNPVSKEEQMNDLLHRLHMLQEFYNLLLETVSFTLDNLKSMYDPKLFDIIITKRAEVVPMQEETAAQQKEPKNPKLHEKTEQDKPHGSEQMQTKLHEKMEQKETQSLRFAQAQPAEEGRILQKKMEAKGSKSTQVTLSNDGPINQKKTRQVKPKGDHIPQDDAPVNIKEEAIDEAMPSTTDLQLEPVNKRTSTNQPSAQANRPKKRKISCSQTKANKKQDTKEYPISVDDHSNMLIIGPNGTTIKKKDYGGLQLKPATGATRVLCDLIFSDEILATHSLTGNQSPAFRGRERPLKKQLDPLKTDDIVHLVCSKFNVSHRLVRSAITTKCADSAKKLKRLSAKNM